MKKTKILIVEDEEDLVDLLKLSLEGTGFEVHAAHDGEEGLKKVKEILPDLVILDVMLPKMTGYEVCRKLKSDEAVQHIPVLIYTSLMEDKEGYSVGADAYFIKSLGTSQDLIFKINELLLTKPSQVSKTIDKDLFLYTKTTSKVLAKVCKKFEQAVSAHQFGILHTIDMKQKMAEKNVDFDRNCLIYEICNPVLAKKALDHEMKIAAVLPCRVAIYEENNVVTVTTMRPSITMGIFKVDELIPLANEIEQKIKKIIDDAVA
ncbi:MAG: response regulator [bacterium]|nr:response regulator [bacterium]MBU1918529.1 response regulator [bacterium]